MTQRYDSYKPSGIEWIGEIPSHWKYLPVKYFFYLKGRIGWQGLKADEFKEEGPHLVAGTDFENGRVNWNKCYRITEERFNEAPEIHVRKGDLLITKDGTVGKLAYIDDKPEKVSLNSHLLIMRPLKDIIDNKYVFWYCHSKAFKDYANLIQDGSIMASLSQEDISNFRVLLPSKEEQEGIAAWLDEKCGEIDAAIAKVDREIELIDELKQSEISRVVTRGLNPNVLLRPSGIDWIGYIPEHWEIRKTSQIFYGIGSGTTPTSGSKKYYCEEGHNWLQTGDLNDGIITQTSKKITDEALKDYSSLRVYPEGSIVIAMYGATIGKLGKLNINTTTNQACCVLPASSIVDKDFAFYSYWAGKQ